MGYNYIEIDGINDVHRKYNVLIWMRTVIAFSNSYCLF